MEVYSGLTVSELKAKIPILCMDCGKNMGMKETAIPDGMDPKDMSTTSICPACQAKRKKEMKEIYGSIEKEGVIRKTKGKNEWCVFSKKGRNMGCSGSESSAKQRLKEVEFFKRQGSIKTAVSDMRRFLDNYDEMVGVFQKYEHKLSKEQKDKLKKQILNFDKYKKFYDNITNSARRALVVLGMKKDEAEDVIARAINEKTYLKVEDLVKDVLPQIAGDE